jgi:hypothetical protein
MAISFSISQPAVLVTIIGAKLIMMIMFDICYGFSLKPNSTGIDISKDSTAEQLKPKPKEPTTVVAL